MAKHPGKLSSHNLKSKRKKKGKRAFLMKKKSKKGG